MCLTQQERYIRLLNKLKININKQLEYINNNVSEEYEKGIAEGDRNTFKINLKFWK